MKKLELISIKGLTKEFSTGLFGKEKIRAVDNVNLNIEESKIVALIGESGSGKTTLGRLLLGLLKPTRGEINFQGEPIENLLKNPREFYRNVQGIFQDPFASFNPIYKIDRIFDAVFDRLLVVHDKKKRREMVEEALVKVGMNPAQILGKYPHQLSGGQLQRLLIARTIIINPKFLVADELISMLDASTRIDILNLLAEIRDDTGMSILFITHDISLAYYISDEALIMYRGSMVEAGDVEKVFNNPKHPYTKALLKSVPEIDRKWDFNERVEEEKEAEGYVPSSGCKYYLKCPIKTDMCKSALPDDFIVEKNHIVKCFNFKSSQKASIKNLT